MDTPSTIQLTTIKKSEKNVIKRYDGDSRIFFQNKGFNMYEHTHPAWTFPTEKNRVIQTKHCHVYLCVCVCVDREEMEALAPWHSEAFTAGGFAAIFGLMATIVTAGIPQ